MSCKFSPWVDYLVLLQCYPHTLFDVYLNLNFILRMTVLGRGLTFQQVLSACTYNTDTIITLQKKIDIIDFYQSWHTQEVDSTSKDVMTDFFTHCLLSCWGRVTVCNVELPPWTLSCVAVSHIRALSIGPTVWCHLCYTSHDGACLCLCVMSFVLHISGWGLSVPMCDVICVTHLMMGPVRAHVWCHLCYISHDGACPCPCDVICVTYLMMGPVRAHVWCHLCYTSHDGACPCPCVMSFVLHISWWGLSVPMCDVICVTYLMIGLVRAHVWCHLCYISHDGACPCPCVMSFVLYISWWGLSVPMCDVMCVTYLMMEPVRAHVWCHLCYISHDGPIRAHV